MNASAWVPWPAVFLCPCLRPAAAFASHPVCAAVPSPVCAWACLPCLCLPGPSWGGRFRFE
ncbi:hypothetical protein CHLRE_04g217960v5 [Chlamydomonas reinhardtii]|uniref:Secreted protein n=1 Tax=Chlamydomonas reinhardtii TaxID=3055 RepID=A0A2K3DTJ4_CHLRE|nr:uncharacterized protein CHLRE_04g217956v5 [Chlamydomonas reinhardtii]XP_042925051.1 uncharacterized protein CHLRE_04g217960v5 [Chlamydomonas reinhardtii]PNW83856.1 hypothetical protein CHLRE_04g217956v5 [Chlamydomonas reinhardtii]PNW83861.1 hypothetical protein CHLRE_04g217960v5 [Chlamydomonas reinhardtii]